MKIHTFLLSLMLIAIQTTAVFACDCNGTPELKWSIDHSQIVFKGTVIAEVMEVDISPYGIQTTGDLSDKNSWNYKWTQLPTDIITIKVEKIYKGKSISDTIRILTSITSSTCGFGFEIGKTYTIFATTKERSFTKIERKSTNDTTYFTHLCSRTGEWKETDEKDIAALMK